MARSELDYGGMMHRAMQGLIAEVLRKVGRDGLPGDHHFFITFDTSWKVRPRISFSSFTSYFSFSSSSVNNRNLMISPSRVGELK